MTDWSKLTVVKLKEELTNRGLAITGKKADLVQRLSEAGAETDDATRKRKASVSDAEPADDGDGGDAVENATNGKTAGNGNGKLAGKKRPAVTKTRQAVGKKGTSADDGAGVEAGEAGEAGEIDSSKAGAEPPADGQQGPDAKRARSASGPDGQDNGKGADPLVKIENALSAERFANIDAGTKRRLAVILDFTKLPPSTLDDAVLEQLRSLSQAEATEIMKQLDHSVRSSKVRKISAYLSSMIRRAREERSAGRDGGGPGIMKANATIEDLAPEARDILSDLTARRHLREGDLDGKVLGTLAAKPPPVQAFMLKAFARKNVADVRNMAAFFVSHMRDMDRGLESGRYSLDRVPGEGDRGGRDHHGRDHHGRDRHGRDKKPVREHRNPHPDIYDPHYTYVPTSLRAAQGFDGHNQLPAPFQHQHQPPQQPPPQQPPFQNQGYDPREQPYARGAPHQPHQPHQPQPEPKHFALEQVQWGVRVDELNGLSDWAKYVHPAAALRMQQLWDQEENKLVSVLDDNSWLLLAGLDAPNSVRAVNETVERMKLSADDVLTVNRLFVEAASKYPRREDAPSMVTSMPPSIPLMPSMPSGPGAAPVVSNLPPQSTTYGNPLFENPNQPARGGPAPYGGGGYAQPPPALAYAAPPTAYAAPPAVATSQVFLPGPAGNLSPRLQNRIDAVMGNPKWLGRIVVDHFNEHVVNLMLQLDERTNMIVLDEFEREDSSKIRNPKAFLIGKIRQALERRDGAGGHRGDGQARGGYRR